MAPERGLVWAARAAVGGVFVINVACALAFILQPAQYTGAFEVEGVPGRVLVQALGILFLMWNLTYPPVWLNPLAQRTLFGVIVAQQALGLAGESWLWASLPAGHPALASTAARFVLFDGLGLVLMGGVYAGLRTAGRRPASPGKAA